MTKKPVEIIPPDFALKTKIGGDIEHIFSASNIAKAQMVITDRKEQFLEWIKDDMRMLNGYCDAAYGAQGKDAPVRLADLGRLALNIKSQAGTFGFDLATSIAKSLEDFCKEHPQASPEQLLVVRKHIDALESVFSTPIAGDGEEVGARLLEALRQLVQKFA